MDTEVKPVVTSANVQITTRCNFKCGHCCQGDREVCDMSTEDTALLMQRLQSPAFGNITLYGGEPRMHPDLGGVIKTVVDQVHTRGTSLTVEVDKDKRKRELAPYYEQREAFLERLSQEEKDELEETGEMGILLTRHFYESPFANKGTFSMEVFTNGFGMNSPERTAEIINGLHQQGINQLTISMDQPHRDYAQRHNIPIDYTFLKKIMQLDLGKKKSQEEVGISGDIFLCAGGNGEYVIPVGRAAGFLWGERLANAEHHYGDEVSEERIEKVKTELGREFDQWGKMNRYSHACYCPPARIVRKHKQVAAYRPEDRLHFSSLGIGADLSVNACGLGVIPPVGNLRDQSVDEIYQTMTTNQLYEILGKEGPQGLARRLTGKPEDELRAYFVKRTPCGMCEDLVAEYPQEIREMIKTSG